MFDGLITNNRERERKKFESIQESQCTYLVSISYEIRDIMIMLLGLKKKKKKILDYRELFHLKKLGIFYTEAVKSGGVGIFHLGGGRVGKEDD